MFERFHPHCHYQSHENLLHFPNYLTCNVFFFFFFFWLHYKNYIATEKERGEANFQMKTNKNLLQIKLALNKYTPKNPKHKAENIS